MGDQLRFDGRVAIVTGAGGGLGKAYALFFASRGAAVVVNDLGTSHTGEGKGSKAADVVVEEIKKAGGKAVANYDSVENGENIVKTAIDAFGRVDIVINNAGILRDVSFIKMKQADWDLIYKVHLFGAYSVTKAAWPYMRDQGYGRVIMTASAAGIYGNFGQANYSAMKLALYGFANTLALEGRSKNINVNTIAPVAGTRMTATILPPELVEALKPEFITPLVAYLCHEKTDVTGSLFEVGAGWMAKLRWERTQGKYFDVSKGLTPEAVRDNWEQICDWANATHPSTTQESLSTIISGLTQARSGGASSSVRPAPTGSDSVDPSKVVGYQFPVSTTRYTEKDVALYALAVGAAKDPVDEKELRFVYENSAGFAALPTMGVIFPSGTFSQVMNVPGLKFNPMMLLHGEQYLEVRNTIPTSGTLTNHGRIKHLYDKGKGAVVVIEADSKDDKGNVIVHNESYLFIRGIGGFGGDRGPSGAENQVPNRPPDVVHKEATRKNEAALYRLASGDMNPLHIDPSMAAIGGFNQPILHGLCTFGYAGRAVLKHFCDNDPARFKSIKVRFSRHVFPGETVVTEMWRASPTKIIFQCKVEERGEYCITNAAVEIHPCPASAASCSSSSSAPAPAAPSAEFKAAGVFANLEKALQEGGSALVKRVNGIYHFEVTHGPGGKSQSWTVDLKTGDVGKISQGAPQGPAGVTLTMSDEVFEQLFTGKINAQTAFMQGKLKIKGDMGLATKLGELIKSKARL